MVKMIEFTLENPYKLKGAPNTHWLEQHVSYKEKYGDRRSMASAAAQHQ